jgi:hypothetical protein
VLAEGQTDVAGFCENPASDTTINDQGKLRIIDRYTNSIVAGERFDLDAEDVIEFCRKDESKWQTEK